MEDPSPLGMDGRRNNSIATRLMGGNINLRVIRKFLGHAQVGTTEWYTHVAPGHFSEASAMIEKMGNGS